MKKTAVLIYDKFCYFEISVALEILSLSGKPVTVFAKDTCPVKSEDGLTIIPDKCISEVSVEEYDSLLLPGAEDIRSAVEDEEIIEFIKKFENNILVGAISIAPVLLLKSGALKSKPFMCGADKEDLFEEGFTAEDLCGMIGWSDNLRNPIEDGYTISGNIITSVSYNFVKFGLQFGKILGIDISPATFGLK